MSLRVSSGDIVSRTRYHCSFGGLVVALIGYRYAHGIVSCFGTIESIFIPEQCQQRPQLSDAEVIRSEGVIPYSTV